MILRRTSPQQGIALVIVMIAITVLSILAAAFAFSMKVETKLAQNANSETELIWLGRSGVEFARYVLAQQRAINAEPYDALNQVWAGGPGGMGTSNSVLAGISLKDYKLGDGKFSITITDLERKFNINSVLSPPVQGGSQTQMLEQGLRLVGVDAGDTANIAAAIFDWIDDNDAVMSGGAEKEYYQTLDPPYLPKNQPMDDITELLLIRGVTPEMYWGAISTNYTRAAFQNRQLGLVRNSQPFMVGLVELFTPLSNGRININTASASVLQMLPNVDESVAARIIELRSGFDGVQGTEDDTPAGGPGAGSIETVLQSAGLNPGVAPIAARFCTVRSDTFEVQVDAEVNGYKRTFYGILGRVSAKDVQILGFYWK